jgi:hypothetical protein
LIVCTSQDVSLNDGAFTLLRAGLFEVWACVEQKRSTAWHKSGYRDDKINAATHVVKIRARPEIDFTTAAYFYEERPLSGSRWFEVGPYIEACKDEYWFDCKVIERNNGAVKPANDGIKSEVNFTPAGIPVGGIF